MPENNLPKIPQISLENTGIPTLDKQSSFSGAGAIQQTPNIGFEEKLTTEEIKPTGITPIIEKTQIKFDTSMKEPQQEQKRGGLTEEEWGLMARVKQEGGTAQDGIEILQEFRRRKQITEQPSKQEISEGELEESIRKTPLTSGETKDNRITNLMVDKGLLPESQREIFEQPEEKISGLDVGVKTGQFVSRIGKGLKLESKEDDKLLESSLKFLANLPGNTVQIAGDLLSVASDPIGTGKAIKDVAGTVVEKGFNKAFSTDVGQDILRGLGAPEENLKKVREEGFFTTQEKEILSNAIDTELKRIAEEPGRLKELIVENPADILLTVSGGLGVAKNVAKSKNLTGLSTKLEQLQTVTNPINVLKGEAFIAKQPLRLVKPVVAGVLGKTTGAGGEAIKQAFKSGGKKSFADALRGKIADEDILNSARKGLETIKENRRQLYGDENYNKLIASKTELPIEPIRNDLITKLDEFKIKIGKEGDLNFNKSTITQPNSQKQIQGIFDDIMTWEEKTPEGMDILKQRVQDRWLGGEGTAKGDVFSTSLGNKIKDRIVAEVPEYAKMTKAYETFSNQIRDIEKTLRIGDPKNKMTAITRLNQTLKDNLGFRKEAVDLLEKASGIDLKSSLAGASLRDIMPKGLQGVVSGGTVGLGLAGGFLNPTIIGGLLASSPRLIGELAIGLGMPVNALKSGLKGLQKVQKAINSKVNPLKPTIIEKTPNLKKIGKNTFKKGGVPANILQESMDIIEEDKQLTPQERNIISRVRKLGGSKQDELEILQEFRRRSNIN